MVAFPIEIVVTNGRAAKYFLISAPVDWTPDQYIRRFLLPTGEYVSCVLWSVATIDDARSIELTMH